MSEKFPQLLVLAEKHGTYYVLVNDAAERQLASTKIIEMRKKDGWYSDLEDVAQLDYTENDIQGMPKSMQASAAKRLYEHEHARNDARKLKALLDRVPSEPEVAWPFLRQRSGYEYERIEIAPLTPIDKL
jgi:hypothetical protein